ncbi:MAG: cell wall hydrolase [Oscillospiraceae bacterium]
MSKRAKSFFALLCAVLLLTGVGASALAVVDLETGAPAKSRVTIVPYVEVPLFADGEFIGSGIMIDSVTYVPLLSFTEAMLGEDCEASWDQESGFTTLLSSNLVITLGLEDRYMTANGRYLYLADGAYNLNGTVLVPIRELAKVFGLRVEWDHDDWAVNIGTSDMALLESGDTFYNQEDLYWLSHVIYAESGNQPLEGMIGVGNVVLNRANDDSGHFADGIRGVIFQSGQFAVAESGAIYLEPNELSVAAAKMCLEGYNTVGDSKWFLNPALSSTKWFDTYKQLSYVIADHNFYA